MRLEGKACGSGRLIDVEPAASRATGPVVLVYRALGLGDLLTAVPSLRAIRAAWPERRVVLAAPAQLLPLIRLVGGVDQLLDVHALEPIPWAMPRAEIAVNLHGSGPRSHQVLLAASPARLIAFRHPEVPESVDGPAWSDDEHDVERWIRLLGSVGVRADPSDLRLRQPSGSATTPGAVVIHPGAGSPARCWPSSRWAEVARALTVSGERVVVTGTSGERVMAERVASLAGLPRSAVLAGRTDLGALAAQLAASRLVLCGDTGIGHLATALAVPSVQLFGPASPARWGPPASGRHVVLWRGRTGNPHAPTPFPDLLAIRPDEVVEAASSLLERDDELGDPAEAGAA